MKAVFIMGESFFSKVYSKEIVKKIKESVEVIGEPLTAENYEDHLDLVEQADIFFSGWGAPVFDQEFLKQAPNLKAIFYAAGTMKKLLPDDGVWERDITITTANTANAVPVAQFALAEILFSLKSGWHTIREVREQKGYDFRYLFGFPGIYQQTVGIVSMSSIGKQVIELLKPFDLDILAYDPFADAEEAEKMGITLVSLEELFQRSQVVSLHTPLLHATRGMITGELLSSMPEKATFINTARGAIVNEEEMIEVLKERPDLYAVLDVTYPEPPEESSPLYELKNVILTPHIAGSVGKETYRLGDLMYSELQQYLSGETLEHRITKEAYKHMA